MTGLRFSLVLVILLAGCITVTPAATPTAAPSSTPAFTSTPAPTVTPRPDQNLPDPASQTPGTPGLVALPSTTPATPGGSPVFQFPTPRPTHSPTPEANCAVVFPLQSLLRIVGERLSVQQLRAVFGQEDRVAGRPPAFTWERFGCTLRVVMGVQAAQRAEVLPYATLGELFDRLGEPAAAAEVPGSSQLPGADRFALLYPAQGVIALFTDAPLSRAAVVDTLRLEAPGDLETLLAVLEGTVLQDGWAVPPL